MTELKTDWEAWLNLSEFATEADFGGNVAIPVIFDEEYVGMMTGTEGRLITATGRSEDLLEIRHNQAVFINGKNYKVVGIHPQDDGKITELELQEL